MKIAIIAATAVAAATLAGCASITSPVDDDYHFGDTTRTYCESTNPAVRDAGRDLAESAGISLIDLCGARSDVIRWGDE